MKKFFLLMIFLAVGVHADPHRELYDLKKRLASGSEDPNIRVRVAQLALATGNFKEAEEGLQWIRKNNVPNWSEWATIQTKYLPMLGKSAPDFEGKDLDGWTIKLSDFQKRILVMHFWNAVDVQSQSSVGQIHEIGRKYKSSPYLSIIGVSLDRDKATLQSVAATQKVTWPQMFDGTGWDSPTVKAFNVQASPMCAVVDTEGILRYLGPANQIVSDTVESIMLDLNTKEAWARTGVATTPRSKDGKVICVRPVPVYSSTDPSKVQATLEPGSLLTVLKSDPVSGRAMVIYDDLSSGATADGTIVLPVQSR